MMGLSDQFFSTVARRFDVALIGVNDDAMRVGEGDKRRTFFHSARQHAQTRLAGFALGNVTDHHDGTGRCVFGVEGNE